MKFSFLKQIYYYYYYYSYHNNEKENDIVLLEINDPFSSRDYKCIDLRVLRVSMEMKNVRDCGVAASLISSKIPPSAQLKN